MLDVSNLDEEQETFRSFWLARKQSHLQMAYKVANRGRGERVLPSKDGGIRQTSPFPAAQLTLLFGGVFVKAVWRVRYHGMNAALFLLLQPVKTVGVYKSSFPGKNGFFHC